MKLLSASCCAAMFFGSWDGLHLRDIDFGIKTIYSSFWYKL